MCLTHVFASAMRLRCLIFFLFCLAKCDGDGRLIPWLYERAIRAQYEDYIYTAVDDYYQDGPPYI